MFGRLNASMQSVHFDLILWIIKWKTISILCDWKALLLTRKQIFFRRCSD